MAYKSPISAEKWAIWEAKPLLKKSSISPNYLTSRDDFFKLPKQNQKKYILTSRLNTVRAAL